MRTALVALRNLPENAPRRAWLLARAATAIGLASATCAVQQATPALDASPLSADGVADVPLVTHEGRPVRFYTDLVRGRIVFVNMMYAQCENRCPPMTQNLKRLHERIGDRAGRDVFMLSISLQPQFDRPQDLRAYMTLNGIERPGWTFLTGSPGAVERLRRSLGFYDRDPEIDRDLAQHTGMVRIGNDALHRWCMAPALLNPELLFESLMAIDPVARAAGRKPVTGGAHREPRV
jgi:protein SCO1